jgi:hypothetical protein
VFRPKSGSPAVVEWIPEKKTRSPPLGSATRAASPTADQALVIVVAEPIDPPTPIGVCISAPPDGSSRCQATCRTPSPVRASPITEIGDWAGVLMRSQLPPGRPLPPARAPATPVANPANRESSMAARTTGPSSGSESTSSSRSVADLRTRPGRSPDAPPGPRPWQGRRRGFTIGAFGSVGPQCWRHAAWRTLCAPGKEQ